MKYIVIIISVVFIAFSCVDSSHERLEEKVKQWIGKEILFPHNAVFTILGEDTVKSKSFESRYHIVSYVDSMGCISCKLQLNKWKEFINQLDSLTNHSVAVSFFIHSKSIRDLKLILKREKFIHPICADLDNSFYSLNKFPSESMFHTFLIDESNKILAIGNPIHNFKVKELYLRIIKGESEVSAKEYEVNKRTQISIDSPSVWLGDFDWKEVQKVNFAFENEGNIPFIIEDVVTSCGCISVKYEKKPVGNKEVKYLEVTYVAEHPEYLDKTITVYCNVDSSPIKLRIRGNATDK